MTIQSLRGDKIIEEETVTTNFNEKDGICKLKSLYILLAYLLINIVDGCYCYLIKYKAK